MLRGAATASSRAKRHVEHPLKRRHAHALARLVVALVPFARLTTSTPCGQQRIGIGRPAADDAYGLDSRKLLSAASATRTAGLLAGR